MGNNKITHNKNIRSLSGYLLVYAVTALIPFITMPIFTRLIAPEDYGRLALAMIYGTIFSGLSNLGMSVAYNREFFKLGPDTKRINILILSSVLFTFILFSVFITITIIFLSDISILVTQSPDNGWLIVGASISCFVNLIYSEYCLNYWRNGQKVRVYMIYALTYLALNTILSLVLVIIFNLGIIGILMAGIIAGGGISLFFLFKTFDWKHPWEWKVVKNSLKISYPLTPQVFVGVLNTQFDKYIINIFGNISTVGFYDIGKRITNQIFAIMTALQNVFLPGVYKRLFASEDKIKHGIGPYLTPFFFLSVLITTGFVLFSEELVLVLLPENYHSVIIFLIPLAVSYAPMFFGKITGQQLVYAKKLNISMLLVFLNTIITTVLNFTFINLYGALGAAFGNLIASFATNGIALLVAQLFCKIDWEWNKIIVLFILLLGGSAAVFIALSMNVDYVFRLLLKSGVLLAFLFTGNRFGIITRHKLREILISLRFMKQET